MTFIKDAHFVKDKYGRSMLKFTACAEFKDVANKLIKAYFGRIPKRKRVWNKWFKVAFIKVITAAIDKEKLDEDIL